MVAHDPALQALNLLWAVKVRQDRGIGGGKKYWEGGEKEKWSAEKRGICIQGCYKGNFSISDVAAFRNLQFKAQLLWLDKLIVCTQNKLNCYCLNQ